MASLSSLSRRLRTIGCALLVVGAAGCAEVDDEESDSGDDAVTSIDNTPVKEQLIGTCWLYTTAAWAESLHLEATGQALNLSESYWTYWHFYDRIVGREVDRNGFIEEQGSWGFAATIIERYGMMKEADFIPEEARDASSDRTEDALNKILFSLSNGKLKTAASRNDRALVRAELDAAFGLRPQAVAWLDATFGKDGRKVFGGAANGAPPLRGVGAVNGAVVAGGAPILRARDLIVSKPTPTGQRTLQDYIGVDFPNIDANRRAGPHAWQYAQYPRANAVERRATLRRIQRALHAGLPVIISWRVDRSALLPNGSFRAPTNLRIGTEAHLSLITDYQASNVPGFGVLPAGRAETRPAALQAALAETANVDVLRIKNSWGAKPRQSSSIPAGYYDIQRGYYNAIFQTSCSGSSCLAAPAFNYAILPPGF
jgi:hypothetical protein